MKRCRNSCQRCIPSPLRLLQVEAHSEPYHSNRTVQRQLRVLHITLTIVIVNWEVGSGKDRNPKTTRPHTQITTIPIPPTLGGQDHATGSVSMSIIEASNAFKAGKTDPGMPSSQYPSIVVSAARCARLGCAKQHF